MRTGGCIWPIQGTCEQFSQTYGLIFGWSYMEPRVGLNDSYGPLNSGYSVILCGTVMFKHEKQVYT